MTDEELQEIIDEADQVCVRMSVCVCICATTYLNAIVISWRNSDGDIDREEFLKIVKKISLY